MAPAQIDSGGEHAYPAALQWSRWVLELSRWCGAGAPGAGGRPIFM